MCSVFGPGESSFELVIPGQSDTTMILIAFLDVNMAVASYCVPQLYGRARPLDVVFSNATIITMSGEVGRI